MCLIQHGALACANLAEEFRVGRLNHGPDLARKVWMAEEPRNELLKRMLVARQIAVTRLNGNLVVDEFPHVSVHVINAESVRPEDPTRLVCWSRWSSQPSQFAWPA